MSGREIEGFLLDLYADPAGGVAIWLVAEDGERVKLRQRFPVTMYAAGPEKRLAALWKTLSGHPSHPLLSRTQRRELFSPHPVTVLSIQVPQPVEQPRLMREIAERFPDLDYFDADIPILPRWAAQTDVFPLTRCRVRADEAGWVQEVTPLESRWAIDPELPPLRILAIEPDSDPFHATPARLRVLYENREACLSLQPGRALVVTLASILRRYDPDLIATDFGDTWLLPHLLQLSGGSHERLPLGRDADCPPQRKKAHSYFSYGQVIHRGEQVLLHGRLHVDRRNAMMFGDYGLEGVYEMARVSGLRVQTAARNSPGAGITAMQIITALQQGILVPYRKQEPETYKTAEDLVLADRGGLIAAPLLGLYENVAEIDFISMYPSILRKFNISAETLNVDTENSATVPGLNLRIDQSRPGLLPQTIGPLIDKRIAIKNLLAGLNALDCRVSAYKARAQAIKWLLVVCFGYTGYRNAKFGRIEAHQSITAYARDLLLTAKQVAEEQGYLVISIYVDCLWICKPGASAVADFQPVLEAVAERTGLPIALDGVFRWINFLPSRVEPRASVANRYFGVFQNGEIKVRGIESRRRDTPAWVNQVQMDILELMAQAPDAARLRDHIPPIVALLRRSLRELRRGRVPLDRLLVRQKLSQEVDQYSGLSATARAARQLQAAGKALTAGDSVRFLYTLGWLGVTAWDLPERPDPRSLDFERYTTLLLRAAASVLTPLSLSEAGLAALVAGCVPLALPFDVRPHSLAGQAVRPAGSLQTSCFRPGG